MIRVGIIAFGVRKRFPQTGCVRMSELTGSSNSWVVPVEKSALGSRFEPISTFISQEGESLMAA
jgi:hypothetical protein